MLCFRLQRVFWRLLPVSLPVCGGGRPVAVPKLMAVALACLATLPLMAAPSRSAEADFSAKDGQVLGRTLGFVGDQASGIAVVGIVYAVGDSGSRQEAQLIQAVIGDGMQTGKVQLRAHLIPIEQLGSETEVQALYVTKGLAGRMDLVSAAAQRLHVPTISADMACVQTGGCVVGFSSEPTVQIIIDRGAAERSGVRFLQAFRMLVREK